MPCAAATLLADWAVSVIPCVHSIVFSWSVFVFLLLIFYLFAFLNYDFLYHFIQRTIWFWFWFWCALWKNRLRCIVGYLRAWSVTLTWLQYPSIKTVRVVCSRTRVFSDTLSESTLWKESFKHKRFLMNSLLLALMPACFDRVLLLSLLLGFPPPPRFPMKDWTQTLNSCDDMRPKQAYGKGSDPIWSDLIRSYLGRSDVSLCFLLECGADAGSADFKRKHSCLDSVREHERGCAGHLVTSG